ncbi:MAG TPA: hypothetical protein DCS93_19075 [Microscillaceae bacterium]|nr:hypothetical protein [Microscillaceae bacterium]
MKYLLQPGLGCILWKKVLFLLLWGVFLMVLPAHSQQLLQRQIQLKDTQGTIQYFLKELHQQNQISFSYDENVLPEKVIKLDKSNWQLKELLRVLERKTQLDFKYVHEQIIIKKTKSTKVKVSGTIRSQDDRESLPGATVFVPELNLGTIADAKGRFQLWVPPGRYTPAFSYIGHQSNQQSLDVRQNVSLDIKLPPQIDVLGEVVIQSFRDNSINDSIERLNPIQASRQVLPVTALKNMPVLAGEPDVLKSLQRLPGIQNATMGHTNFSVRGGSYDQNLILFDGIPLYNTAHSAGFFSTINPDIIQSVHFYKGNLPARFGGRLSSVVDIKSRNQRLKKLRLKGGVGLISSRLTLEGPIGKKTSFFVAGRQGYPGSITNLFDYPPSIITKSSQDFTGGYTAKFSDIFTGFNIAFNTRNQLRISGFYTQDEFSHKERFIFGHPENTYRWKSIGGAITWDHQYNHQLQSQLKLIYSDLHYQTNGLYERNSGLQQAALNLDFTYEASSQSKFKFGLATTGYYFQPTEVRQSNNVHTLILPSKQALETSIYLDHQLRLGKKWVFNYGVRVSGFYNLGAGVRDTYDDNYKLVNTTHFNTGDVIDQFYGIEPRFSAQYTLNKNNFVRFSYTRTYQYLHQISNTAISLPADTWIPADNNIKPRFADQLTLGYFYHFGKDKQYTLSSEMYYKQVHHSIDYKDNAQPFFNQHLATQIRLGQDNSYGLELMLAKSRGKLTGWISYTLSKTTRQANGINNDKVFVPHFDRRHNVSLTFSYALGKRWVIATNYAYMSGTHITVPQGQLVLNNRTYNLYSGRNSYQLPNFHQWDLNVILKSRQRKKWQGEWVFGVTNIYNQKNTSMISRNKIVPPNLTIHRPNFFSKTYLFGWVPSITYNFKF